MPFWQGLLEGHQDRLLEEPCQTHVWEGLQAAPLPEIAVTGAVLVSRRHKSWLLPAPPQTAGYRYANAPKLEAPAEAAGRRGTSRRTVAVEARGAQELEAPECFLEACFPGGRPWTAAVIESAVASLDIMATARPTD